MALTRSFPIDSGFPNALDLRRLDAGLIVREGVFPDPTTTAAAGVAYGDGGWNVGAVAFVAALKRGGAPYSLSYGVARLANDAAGTAWTIDAAPASGSRIDLLWIRATDPGEGEATSGTDGPGGVARAVPVFGVTTGVAATTPVAPALPAGALLIATVTTPSGAASIAGSTIVQSYKFAQLAGGIRYARTLSEFSDEPGYVGEEAITLTSYQRYRYDGAAWVVAPYVLKQTVQYTASGTFVKADYPRARALRVRVQGGGGGSGGCAATGAGQFSMGGSGGGGAHVERFITDVASLAASETITVGAAGAAGTTTTGGGDAADSSAFGAIGAGGRGGGFGSASAPLTGAAGTRGGVKAPAGTYDVGVFGGGASQGFALAATALHVGAPGTSPLATRFTFAQVGGTGVAATAGLNYGGGALAPANTESQAAARAGAAGGAGVVIVEVFE